MPSTLRVWTQWFLTVRCADHCTPTERKLSFLLLYSVFTLPEAWGPKAVLGTEFFTYDGIVGGVGDLPWAGARGWAGLLFCPPQIQPIPHAILGFGAVNLELLKRTFSHHSS